MNTPPLVMHIIHRLAVGGLENGLINLINHMPPHCYRHMILSLTDATSYAERIVGRDVPIITLGKREGNDFHAHARVWSVLRRFRPDIVHTRNLGTLEYLVSAALAGVSVRVHGEHGRDIYDLDGMNRKYNLLRKAIRPFVTRYITVSRDLRHWLLDVVEVRPDRIAQIYNGIDSARFHPQDGAPPAVLPPEFGDRGRFIIGTVGRMAAVKGQLNLVRAFLHLRNQSTVAREMARLVIVGDGELREPAVEMLRTAGAEEHSWLPGERSDIPDIMRCLDLFVLPSLGEGISNTILEAMACARPVVATRVGGNPELVDQGRTGLLVPPTDPIAMAEAIGAYLSNPDQLTRHGQAARKRVEQHFSMEAMVNGYLAVYDAVLHQGRQRTADSGQKAAS